jgi:DNA-binding NtrC family response regulator
MLNERFGSRKRLGDAALQALERHDWPGNVRELLHVVESAMVVCDDTEVRPEHLPPSVRTRTAQAAGSRPGAPPPTLQELERTHIEAVLRGTDGHRGNAAKILGISERNLYRKLKEYDLL